MGVRNKSDTLGRQASDPRPSPVLQRSGRQKEYKASRTFARSITTTYFLSLTVSSASLSTNAQNLLQNYNQSFLEYVPSPQNKAYLINGFNTAISKHYDDRSLSIGHNCKTFQLRKYRLLSFSFQYVSRLLYLRLLFIERSLSCEILTSSAE